MLENCTAVKTLLDRSFPENESCAQENRASEFVEARLSVTAFVI